MFVEAHGLSPSFQMLYYKHLEVNFLAIRDIICFMCWKVGHYVQDCPDDDSGDTVSEFFGPTAEPSPALRPATPHPRCVTPIVIN